jgi:hypothetical protein
MQGAVGASYLMLLKHVNKEPIWDCKKKGLRRVESDIDKNTSDEAVIIIALVICGLSCGTV